MRLPVMPPVAPMLAKSAPAIPAHAMYEPKWDGFRCIVFRDGDEVELGSRGEKPLTRYFPEVVAAVKAQLPERCVVDGEIVIISGAGLDFDLLSQRIHPAASRVAKLSVEIPASLVVFDLLALGDASLMATPFTQRRARLTEALAETNPPIYLTPSTTSIDVAQRWFSQFEGAGLDGIVAKTPDGHYLPDKRAMVKVKHERTADCVLAGFRWHKTGDVVGSLLLGLYDERGVLQHVGASASFPMARRAELVAELEPYRITDGQPHPWQGEDAEGTEGDRRPGAPSRWSSGKDLAWVPLRPELVCEVAYDHMEGDRFRHTTQFRRWRTDRSAASCTYAQLDRPVTFDVADVLRHEPVATS